MPPNTSEIGAAVQKDLKDTIKVSIATEYVYDFEEGRAIAAETIKDLICSWSTVSGVDKATTKPDTLIDKIHLVYSAAQRLYKLQDEPDSLPAKIIACFTKQIKDRGEITAGHVKEIIDAGSRAQYAQMEKIRAAEKAIEVARQAKEAQETAASQALTDPIAAEAQRAGKKRKAVEGADELEEGKLSSTQARSLKSRKKAKMGDAVGADDQRAAESGGSSVETNKTAPDPAQSDPSIPSTNTPKKSSPASKSPTKGPGNYGHEHSTKWYADEEQFGRGFIQAKPGYTHQQLADAITARFKGTFYSDQSGKQMAGMREGRTANAVRLHFRSFKQGLKGQGNGGVQASSGQQLSGGSAPQQSSGEQGSGQQSTKPQGQSQSQTGAQGAPEKASDVPAASTSMTASSTPKGKGRDSDAETVVIYTSGKMVTPAGKNSGTEQSTAAAADGVQIGDRRTTNTSEIGEDETPLDDLEEMVDRTMNGEM